MAGRNSLIKAVVFTRGRTGSSAIIDELGKMDHSLSMQEIFSRDPGSNPKYYPSFGPFNAWREKCFWNMFLSEKQIANMYLKVIERGALEKGYKEIFWKTLSHHFQERPYLAKLLRRHRYKAIYLKRNIVRQVLSGMVANQRNLYNSDKKIEDSSTYFIDLEQFHRHIRYERKALTLDRQHLTNNKISFIEVSYEDFVNDRKEFFREILEFLGLPPALPEKTDLVIMIEDLRSTIRNYDEVQKAVIEMGEAL